MSRENPRWGAKRVLGELEKLSLRASKRTVQRLLRRERPRPPRAGQAWATFVRNHLGGTWACDFFTVPVGLWSTLYVWFVLDLGTRRVLHWNVTDAPTDEWLAHQARAVTDFAQGPRYLIRDRDGKFGPRFDAVFEGCGTKIVKTPPRTPVANAFAERFVGSTRREVLAHLIVLGEDHLRIHMARWVAHYNGQRPHQGLGQRIPAEVGAPRSRPATGAIRSVPVMGGLSHHYERAAA
ncbi:MAG: integrase core domain-containing protein [Planctomycetes bacterium]|nr:integrase core domain-containing protein [Planctomycetota bacterium]